MFDRNKRTVKDEVKDAEKVNRTGARELEREARNLDREEAKLIAELKCAAKRGGEAAAAPLAKQLVHLRQRRARLTAQAARVKGLTTTMKTHAAMHTTATALGSSAAAMGKVSAAMEPQRMAAQAQEFAMQNGKLDMASEAMDDAIEGMFDGDDAEADDVMAQVLDEIGVEAVAGAAAAPKAQVAMGATETTGPGRETQGDAEIEKLLESLRSA